MTYNLGLLEESTLKVVKVFRDSKTGGPVPVSLRGLRKGLTMIDCDTNGTPALDAGDTVRDLQWSRVIEDRAARTIDVLEMEGVNYIASNYAIEAYKDAISEEEESLTVITADGSSAILTLIELKSLMRAYRQRKKDLSAASWVVESKIKQSAQPGTIDVLSVYSDELDKISELS